MYFKECHFKFIYFRLAETKSFVLRQLIQSKQLCTCKLGMAVSWILTDNWISIGSYELMSGVVSNQQLGTFIPGSLGSSLAVCRDNNKHGGSVTNNGEVVLLFSILHQQFSNAKSSRGIDQVLSFDPWPWGSSCLHKDSSNDGINWHSGHICVDIERTRVLIFLTSLSPPPS